MGIARGQIIERVKRHFRVVNKRKQRGRPKKKQENSTTKNNEDYHNAKITRTKTKTETKQSSLTTFLMQPPNVPENSDNDDDQPSQDTIQPHISNATTVRHKKRKAVNDIDNYTIVRRTNIITYQRTLQTYRDRMRPESTPTTPQQRLKRRHCTPSPDATLPITLLTTPGSSSPTDTNPKKTKM